MDCNDNCLSLSNADQADTDADGRGDACDLTLGDFVWEDLNLDGIQDDGEPGISGAEVFLYDCADDAQSVSSAETGDDGYYAFDDLMPGNYYVEFILPERYSFIQPDQGDDDEADSDADRESGQTACITLDPGVNDLTQDAGMCPDNDEDDVCNIADNCPDTANTDQADADGDGYGDVCDPACDLGGDADADADDRAILNSILGKCTGDEGFIPRADYDGNGCIGMSDYQLWYQCHLN
jgi:hypothetical protein